MRKTILIIDDDIGTRESVRLLLTPEYEVICVDSVAGGLQVLKEHKIALVISDLRTGEFDGMGGLEAIREYDPDLPVIMLTGYGTPDVERQALDRGASAFIVKPFELEAMRDTVRKHSR